MNSPLMGFEGEFGWYFAIETSFDASSYTSAIIRFKAPDGTRTDKTATPVTTAADGDFQWQTTDGFLTKGDWVAQLHILQGATALYKSRMLAFHIGPSISAT